VGRPRTGNRTSRTLLVVACLAAVLAAVGTRSSAGADAPPAPATPAPVCTSLQGEKVCVAGWSTGVTFTYSGSSSDGQGGSFQNGFARIALLAGSPIVYLGIELNWHGTGTLYVPTGPGQWALEGGVYGAQSGPHGGASALALVEVGPGQPAPPTTCSTVAQGPAQPTPTSARPWVSGIAATDGGGCPGYWMASPEGTVNAVGGPPLLGGGNPYNFGVATGGVTGPINGTVVGMARTPDSGGYWLAASDGGVFAFGSGVFATGDARFFGSMAGRALAAPVVGMAATPDGKGYWLVGSDGGVFAFGDARFFGSMAGRALAAPVVGMAATADGRGYWLVGSDGGVFAFGDATFRGSAAGRALAAPVVGVAADPQGTGYRLVAADGGVFAFGAPFLGSMGGTSLSAPVTGISPAATGEGYYLVGADAAVYAFGSAPYLGAPQGVGPAPIPVVGN